jgi:outer membrane protein assembly factor BamB
MSQDPWNLYVVDDASHVWALSKSANGSTVWVQDKLHARPVSGVSYLKDSVLIGDFEGYLHALDSSDGRFIARKKLGSGINVAPIVVDDVAYVLSSNGILSAIKLERKSASDNT